MSSWSHGRAAAVMVAAALMWSSAGVVARHLQTAQGFEVTFWRSAFNALALTALLSAWRGPRTLWRAVRHGERTLWLSGACWSVMFTAFMLAITLTTVANVLVTMALAPLFTALLAWLVLRQRLPGRTWAAVLLAGIGLAAMFGDQVRTGDARHWLGTAVALAVPLAASVNWTVLQRARAAAGQGTSPDLMPAVLIGAVLSAAMTLLPAWPLSATPHDLAWLAALGLGQLAVPCLLAVAAARVLSAPEVALLALLEVIFGVLWAWWGAGERPTGAVLAGGGLVLLALAGNELAAMGRARLG